MQTYSTQSANESGTMYYYKNILDARNFKGKVKNSYKVYKMLDRTVFDAMCCVIFLQVKKLEFTNRKKPYLCRMIFVNGVMIKKSSG